MYKVEIRKDKNPQWRVVELHKYLEDAKKATAEYTYLYETRVTK